MTRRGSGGVDERGVAERTAGRAGGHPGAAPAADIVEKFRVDLSTPRVLKVYIGGILSGPESRELCEAFAGPCEFVDAKGYGHVVPFQRDSPFGEQIREFLGGR